MIAAPACRARRLTPSGSVAVGCAFGDGGVVADIGLHGQRDDQTHSSVQLFPADRFAGPFRQRLGQPGNVR